MKEWFYDDNQRVYIDGEYKATVSIDEWFDPREAYSNIGKMCFRKHRDYRFPNELDFDFDAYDEGEIKIPGSYYIFRLDCYEHTGIKFSFAGEGTQCKWDTTHHCGFIAVPKKYNAYDFKEINKTPWKEGTDHYDPEELSQSKAEEIARRELDIYNKYINGKVYEYKIYKKLKLTSEYGDEEYEWECQESADGYWDEVSAKEDAIYSLEIIKIDIFKNHNRLIHDN